MLVSWELRNDSVLLKTAVPASWLAAATGAPWQEGDAGLQLYAWDTDGLEPEHTKRRLTVRARQATAVIQQAGPLPLDARRISIQPALIPSADELPVLLQGFELFILDDLATMADLAEAVDQFGGAYPWSRTRSKGAAPTCEGCPQCCAEPVPISAVDVGRLARLGHRPNLGTDGDLTGCMVPGHHGVCSFLHRESGRCSVHPDRPWVCRTYFCCPEGPVFEAVREEILGHMLASLLDLGVNTPLRHTDDYRKVLLIDLLSEPVWTSAQGAT